MFVAVLTLYQSVTWCDVGPFFFLFFVFDFFLFRKAGKKNLDRCLLFSALNLDNEMADSWLLLLSCCTLLNRIWKDFFYFSAVLENLKTVFLKKACTSWLLLLYHEVNLKTEISLIVIFISWSKFENRNRLDCCCYILKKI